MIFDFGALLLLLTLSSGLVWGLEVWLFARFRQGRGGNPLWATLVYYARSLFPIFLIVLALRSFLIEPFRIPSASMMPTLERGDFILVNKYQYGLRLPLFNARMVEIGTPQRGDVMVFRYPEDPSVPYIKRVVGVPGDRIEYRNKTLSINGREAPLTMRGVFHEEGGGVGQSENGAYRISERLDGQEHEILIHPFQPPRPEVDTWVPPGHYFVLGDNRDNSRDSRYWGLVPDENVMGRAFFIWMNWSAGNIFNPGSWAVDWSRIGSTIK